MGKMPLLLSLLPLKLRDSFPGIPRILSILEYVPMKESGRMSSNNDRPQIWLIRHAETAWSLSGQHTGRTDIPLTPKGEKAAAELKPWLAKIPFDIVLSSPLSRAMSTAKLSGLENQVQPEPLLLEWDYGAYEGLKNDEIQKLQPGWDIWRNGCPGGETLEQVHQRAVKLLAKCEDLKGNIALFSHGHFSRSIIATWLGLPAVRGGSFAIRAGSVTVLGWEHSNKVIWNCGNLPDGPGIGK